MATADLIARIQGSYPGFTRAERKVADYVLAKPGDVLFMSITDLADACAVGETSVFRFCRTLRLQGYQAFKMHMAQTAPAESSADAPPAGEIGTSDTLAEVAHKLLATHMAALSETFDQIRPAAASRAVEMIRQARRVVFFGVGSSSATALAASNKFLRITGKTSFVLDSHLQAMTAALMEPRDLAVIFSYSGSTRDSVEIARICRRNGVPVIGITRFSKSPLASHCELVLLSGAKESPLQGGSISAMIAQLYLIDFLHAEYFRQTQEQSSHNRTCTSAAVADKLY